MGGSTGGCNFEKLLPVIVPKCHREKVHFVLKRKLFKTSNLFCLEASRSFSITSFVAAMKTLIQERDNHTENYISVNATISRITQKVEFYFTNEQSGPAIFSTDLQHDFVSIDGNDFGMMFREKGRREPGFAYDLLCIHSFTNYTDLIEQRQS